MLYCKILLAVLAAGIYSVGWAAEKKLVIGDFSRGGMGVQNFFGTVLENKNIKLPDDLSVNVRQIAIDSEAEKAGCDVWLDENILKWDEKKFAVQDYALLPVIVVVHADNPLESIAVEDLKRIYSGRIASWERLHGKSMPIRLGGAGRKSPAGRAFRFLVMKEDILSGKVVDVDSEILPDMLELDRAASAGKLLRALPELIVFGAWDLAAEASGKFKVLKINGIEPSRENICSGRYPLVIKHSLRFLRNNPPLYLPEFAAFLRESAEKNGAFLPVSVKK